MQVTSCFLLATLSILHQRAVGSPIFERQATNLVAVPINATFDEDNLNLLDNIVNIITHPPYGTRSGLSYDAFTVASPQDLIIGTHANSLPNVLVFDVLSSIREGKTMIQAPGPPNAVAFGMKSFVSGWDSFPADFVLTKAVLCLYPGSNDLATHCAFHLVRFERHRVRQ